MESLLEPLVESIAKYGIGPLVAAVFLALYLLERKAHGAERLAHSKTTGKVIELCVESVKSDQAHTNAIQMLTKVLEGIDRRI